MNSPPTPPYCGSVAAALHLMKSQCGSCREKVLFIALRWMKPDRGMMWQAENPELARDFPADTASKARQSRLHQAQGVFPVFVFHSFVQFLNNSCSKNKNFSPLMSINCLVKCLINSEQFVFKNKLMAFNEPIHEHSCFKKRPFTSLSLYLSPIREIRVSKQHTKEHRFVRGW